LIGRRTNGSIGDVVGHARVGRFIANHRTALIGTASAIGGPAADAATAAIAMIVGRAKVPIVATGLGVSVLQHTTAGGIAFIVGARIARVRTSHRRTTAATARLASGAIRTRVSIVALGAIGCIDQLAVTVVTNRVFALRGDRRTIVVILARTHRRIPRSNTASGVVTGIIFGAFVGVITARALVRGCRGATTIDTKPHIASIRVIAANGCSRTLTRRTHIRFGAGIRVVALGTVRGIDQRAHGVLTSGFLACISLRTVSSGITTARIGAAADSGIITSVCVRALIAVIATGTRCYRVFTKPIAPTSTGLTRFLRRTNGVVSIAGQIGLLTALARITDLTFLTFHCQELSGIHTGFAYLALVALFYGAAHIAGFAHKAVIGFHFVGTFVLGQITGSGLARSALVAVRIHSARLSWVCCNRCFATSVQTEYQNQTSESDIQCTHTRLLVPP